MIVLETNFKRFTHSYKNFDGTSINLHLRIPQPYEYTFKVNVKQRWIGKRYFNYVFLYLLGC